MIVRSSGSRASAYGPSRHWQAASSSKPRTASSSP